MSCFYDVTFGQTKMEAIRERKLLFEIVDRHNARFIAQKRGSFQTVPLKSSLSIYIFSSAGILHLISKVFFPLKLRSDEPKTSPQSPLCIQSISYITSTFGSKTASFANVTSKVEEKKTSLGTAHIIAGNLRAHVRSMSKPPTFHIASLNR